MDIKRDEAFEEAYAEICKPIIRRPYPRNQNGEYVYKEIHEAHLMWQQAQKVAVLDGCVVVLREPTHEMYRSFQDGFNNTQAGNTAQNFKAGYKAMIEAQEQAQ